MRELERHAAEIGLPPEVLMENAGLAIAQEVRGWLGTAAASRSSSLSGRETMVATAWSPLATSTTGGPESTFAFALSEEAMTQTMS